MANTFESNGTYADTTFKKVDVRQKTITSAVFSDCTFVRCDFTETELYGCRFIACHFDDCTMKMAKVKDSTFSRMRFTQCNLLGVDWTLANWPGMSAKATTMIFETCVLQYSLFFGLKLHKIVLKDCNAQEANFSEADLTGGDFAGSDLAGAIFLKTTLTNASFVDAKNYTINLQDNTTKGTKFSLPEAMRLLYAMDIVIVDPDAINEDTAKTRKKSV